MRLETIAGVLIAAALAVSSGCAQKDWIDRTLVTVDVSGTWYGRGSGGSGTTGTGSVGFAMQLEQQGATVKGSIFPPSGAGAGPFLGPIDGTVAGDVFRFRNARG